MKKLLLSLLTLAVMTAGQFASAQIIDIPDVNFKNALIEAGVDKNGDGEIQESEALEVTVLSIKEKDISSLKGIEYFINLNTLYCSQNNINEVDLGKLVKLTKLNISLNQLTHLDVSNLKNLNELECAVNNIASIDLSNLTELKRLNLGANQLTHLDVSNLKNLTLFSFDYNQLTNIDISNLESLTHISAAGNKLKSIDFSNNKKIRLTFLFDNPIEVIYFKNGAPNIPDNIIVTGQPTMWIFEDVPNLKYICVDSMELDTLRQYAIDNGYPDVIINSFCSGSSAGSFNQLSGQAKLDLNKDGCDESDIPFPFLKVKISNDENVGYLVSGSDGDFSINLQAGSYTFEPVLSQPEYYSVSPESAVFSLPETASPNFCITPKGDFNDLAVSLIPVKGARPGFSDATYRVVYKNQGTTTQSGSVTLNFDGDRTKVISSAPVADLSEAGQLTFDFNNLAPFESRSVTITMRTNAPTDIPAVNAGDILEFSAEVIGQDDETPEDNIATLQQTVVGSFDPNDKTCLQGDIISPDLVGKPVHYLIRFENTGTASAENIVVTDYIDTTVFDISTLSITDASHECHTQVKDGNKVQFMFNDIQLPFTEPDKHGYVAFSIQLKDHLQIGDSIKNQADIYFDYNLPITTNEAASEINIKAITSVKQRIGNINLSVYPNPSKGNISVELNSASLAPVQISVMDISGKIVFAKQYAASQNLIPLQLGSLAKGVYLVRAEVDSESVTKKVVMQ